MGRAVVGLLPAVVLAGACASFDPEAAARFPTPLRGMVVCEHPEAARVGKEILEAGGNAADAAVATALALAVVLPDAGNLGGGGLAIWVAHDASHTPLALDFRETAPAALTQRHFLGAEGTPDPSLSLDSALGVGVPGSPAGLHALHQRVGVLSWREVCEPAIRLAEEGFRVDAWLAAGLADEDTRRRLCRAGPEGAAATVFYADGVVPREGDLLVQPALASTLRRLARDGPAGFYRGPVARALVRTVQQCGGVLSQEDLERYQVKWRQPLVGWFRGLEIVTFPPPSSGGLVLLQVLSLLDGFPLDEEIASAREEAERLGRPLPADRAGLSGRAVHWWIEAMRRAFADRARHMGDPDFYDVPVGELLSPAWIAERRVSIGEFANPDVLPFGLESLEEGGETTHLSVLDGDGNAVSLTTTLNTGFGTGILVPDAGFFLNNELDDFALFPDVPNAYGLVGGEANALAPRKRPLSSMTPTVVREGGQTVRWVIGSPGGPRIITAVLQVLLRAEVYGQSLAAAVAAPRLHQQWRAKATRFEPGWDPLLLERLRGRRHGLETVDGSFGCVQAIRVEVGGDPEGASDSRGGGAVGAQGLPLTTPARPPGR